MATTYTSKFPELGFYGLPGHTRTPRDLLPQVIDAERLGIGNVMISERADYKEISAVCGACAAVTESIFIGTSGTNLNTRHRSLPLPWAVPWMPSLKAASPWVWQRVGPALAGLGLAHSHVCP